PLKNRTSASRWQIASSCSARRDRRANTCGRDGPRTASSRTRVETAALSTRCHPWTPHIHSRCALCDRATVFFCCGALGRDWHFSVEPTAPSNVGYRGEPADICSLRGFLILARRRHRCPQIGPSESREAEGALEAQGPSGASPARSSARQTPGASDNTSPRSPRSGGWRPPCSDPARPEHRPAAASRRSLQACIASLPLRSSWMSKTYLKSDHFNGGGQ